MTDAERVLWRHLRQRQRLGVKFRRQHPIAGYIVDFVCIDARLIVEIDGGHHAGQSAQDAERTTKLEVRGYRVLRFWNNDVLGNLAGVAQTIDAVLGERVPPPPPSP